MLNANANPYNCPVCNQGYGTRKCLQRHVRTHFDDGLSVCQVCASVFASRSELFVHKRTHKDGHPYKCSECFMAFRRRDSFVRHVNVHWQVELKCHLCDKALKNEKSLDIHLKIHSGEKPYQCDLCDSAFVCKEYLSHHKKKVHNIGNVLYQCDVCEKIFKNSVALRLHKISHSDDRPHICHMCPMTFKHKANLKEHLRRHICAKPYICQVCSKGFSSWAGLNEHKGVHSSARNFQCETCGKSYRRKSHLARHNWSHEDIMRYACKYCGKRFRYRRAMNVHIRSHTGHRPYACDLCGHQFAQKSRMKSHRMTHTGEKPFRCVACSKAFCRHDKLTDHCRRMHKQLIDMDKSLSSPFKTGTSNGGSNQSDTNDELRANNTKHKPDAKNNSDWNRNRITESYVSLRRINTSTGSYITRPERNHGNGDIVRTDEADDSLNSRRGNSTIVVRNGEEDVNMSLKIEVFDETELTDDYFLEDNSTEFLIDGEADEKLGFRQCVEDTKAGLKITWPKFLTREQTTSRKEVGDLMEQNNDGSNSSVGGHSEVMDCDEAAEVTDSDDVTILEDEEEHGIEEAADDIPAAAEDSSLVADNICFWSDDNSIQDDEDFLLAMRVFQLLKSYPPGVEKNSFKAQVEDMLLDATKISPD